MFLKRYLKSREEVQQESRIYIRPLLCNDEPRTSSIYKIYHNYELR